jgi:hypothetical protein
MVAPSPCIHCGRQDGKDVARLGLRSAIRGVARRLGMLRQSYQHNYEELGGTPLLRSDHAVGTSSGCLRRRSGRPHLRVYESTPVDHTRDGDHNNYCQRESLPEHHLGPSPILLAFRPSPDSRIHGVAYVSDQFGRQDLFLELAGAVVLSTNALIARTPQ